MRRRGITLAALQILLFMVLTPAPTGAAGETTATIVTGQSLIDVVVENGPFDISKDGLLDWIRSAAQSVTTYYGRFPQPHILIRITPVPGEGVRHGVTYPWKGGLITILVGAGATPADFQSDWEMTHEMVHLAFPSVADNHHWIEEGIATYVEPIARVRAHHFDVTEMWYELVRDLPQGLPAPGDRGLDNTHTWGRTYWGGALFCLLADVEIHRETQNKKGLDDALRGILNAGGNITVDWDLQKALEAGDRATGVPVLANLYEKMKDSPYDVDLDALWKQLGVQRNGTSVVFDDSAPLAATRKAITYGEDPAQ
ncbi:MAG TPA: hypothetical protein VMB02_03245 [Candidatus Aquilonibacter sp.]|nr:hypothetical protein [Candidatus Aquilonibacter sp.]